MEKRAVLAALLMAALLIVYQSLFLSAPDAPQPSRPETPTQGLGPTQPGTAPAMPAVTVPAPVPVPPTRPQREVPERTTRIETPLYQAVISSLGGSIQKWDLSYKGHKPMVVPGVLGPRGLTVERPGGRQQIVRFEPSADEIRLGPQTPQAALTLRAQDGFGLEITRTLHFRADSYVVMQDFRVENLHTAPQQIEIAIPWAAPVEWPKDQVEKFPGQFPIHVVRLVPGSFWVRRSYLKDTGAQVGPGAWIGLESDVYLAALVPRSPEFKIAEAKRSETGAGASEPAERVEIALRASLPQLQPGQSWEGRALAYIGPKDYDRLQGLGVGLEKAIYFGGFPIPESWAERYAVPTLPMEWVTVPIFRLMRWMHDILPNYGVAIIFLTVLTKVLFFPLSLKSMRSMKAMQAIQPQVNALRSKYKSDPQRIQRETMDLYRQHKVNPLGGCLPMVVQVPIFYALYVALYSWVEIQNAPFICFGRAPNWLPLVGGQDLWICNLAAYDPTYILPLLMGISMFVQQKMTPIMGDPRQAKMMLFMPVVFTFMFLNLPSGLVLYWTLSNVLQIGQQLYMDRGAKGPVEKAQKVEKLSTRSPKKA